MKTNKYLILSILALTVNSAVQAMDTEDPMQSIHMSPDGKMYAIGQDGIVKIYDAHGNFIKVLTPLTEEELTEIQERMANKDPKAEKQSK